MIFEEFSIRGVKLWDSEKEEFSDFDIMIKFNTKKIAMFGQILNKEFYSIDIPEDSFVKTEVISVNDPNNSILKLSDSTLLLMRTIDAEKVHNYYESYKEHLEEEGHEKQKRIIEISYSIEGLENMAINLIEMIDKTILLNHDTFICLQRMYSYDKYRDVDFLDENAITNENVLLGVLSIKQAINNMVEIIQEDYSEFTEEELNFACWETVKRVSIKFYADIWEEKYGKFIDKKLKQNELQESDGTLDRYIEDIILCNEIDNEDAWVMCTFTYYMMDRGYVAGELYYPPYLEIAVKAFSTLKSNMEKNRFKEKLKGTVEKQETHYSIDDVDLMNGNEFEHFICELYNKMGYSSEVTKQSGDQGLDVIAEKNNKRIGIQAKCYSNTVGNSAVQEAVAGKCFYNCDKVVVITNNYFTPAAIELAQSNDVILWNRDILKEKIRELM
ncbi:restriction endonuclease [Lacrimispora brassicae]